MATAPTSMTSGLDYFYDQPSSDGPVPEILIHHGTADPLVTVDRGRAIRDTLTRHGVNHTYREYPMQHEISMASIHDLRDWLAGLA